MSFDATRWAWVQNAGSAVKKCILLALADAANKDKGHKVWISIPNLRKKSEANKDTIASALDEFEEAGLIRNTGKRAGKTGRVPIYQLVGVEEYIASLGNGKGSDPNTPENRYITEQIIKDAQDINTPENRCVAQPNTPENRYMNAPENRYMNAPENRCMIQEVTSNKRSNQEDLAQLTLRECAKPDPISLNGEDSIGQIKGEPQQGENPGILINDHPQQIEVPVTLVTDQAQLEEPNPKIDSQGQGPTTKSKLQNSGSSRDAGCANGAYSEAFERWWNVYPRKKDKVRAYRAWRRKKLDGRADELIADVKKRLAEDPSWIDLQYISYPERYINSERWNDDITQPSPARVSNSKPTEPKMPIPPIVRASEKTTDPVDIDAAYAQIQEARRRIYGQT